MNKKYKLGIFSNFSYPSIGGTEAVLRAVAESMFFKYNFDVTICAHNVVNNVNLNGIYYERCQKGKNLIDRINDFDHIFIYSDSFWGWPDVLNSIDKIKPRITIALVGMYHMMDHPSDFEIFKKNSKKINVITHFKEYQDYKKCFDNQIPITVIPNGVDIDEFNKPKIKFREKYNIKTDNLLINVSNFFYGKGQEYLADIGQELKNIRCRYGNEDFTIVSISNSVKYPYESLFMERCRNNFKNKDFPYLFLRNIKREDVIAAFCSCNIFVFPSRKEVFPIVILEAMAASTPWISMDVGNVGYLEGGIAMCNPKVDKKGYKIIDKDMIISYAKNINGILDMYDPPCELGSEGNDIVEKYYQWDNITEKYYNIFLRDK